MAHQSIGQGGLASIRLDELIPAATRERGAQLAVGEQERGLEQDAAIRQALQGADLTNRGDVLGRLQRVAPQQALGFQQQTRGQPQEDIEFGVFVAQRLANAARGVTDQAGFDALKKQALDLGFTQEAVDKLGTKFDKAKLDQAAAALEAINPQTLQEFGAFQEVPGQPGLIGQPSAQTGKFANVRERDIPGKAGAKRKGGELRKFDKEVGGTTFTITEEFDAKSGKFKELARAPRLSSGQSAGAKQKNFENMISAGVPEQIARGVSFGTFETRRDPLNFQMTIVDLAEVDPNRQVIGRFDRKGKWVANPAAQQPRVEPTADPTAQRGGQRGAFAGRNRRQRIQEGQLVDIEA